MTSHSRSLALALVLVSAIACSLVSSGPAATAQQFYRHLEKGQIEDAHTLLSSTALSQLPAEKLRSGLEAGARQIASRGGIRSIKVEKEEVQGELASVTLLITYGNGSTETDTSKLVKEKGRWKLAPSK